MRIVVFISGYGSNLQAIIDKQAANGYDLAAVISSNPEAHGLQRAQQANISNQTISRTNYDNSDTFCDDLIQSVSVHEPDFIALAGYMKKLPSRFVNHFDRKIINIHPSLLPKHPGLNTFQRALDAGDKEHGTTVHIVTPEIDQGPALCSAALPITDNDTPEALKQKTQRLEHELYPTVLHWLSSGQLIIESDTIVFNGNPLENPIAFQPANL